jgi:5-methyltetrahydrofolate--homocysteine methyltransferase
MTVISSAHGKIEFGPGLPSQFIHENLRVFGTTGENKDLVNNLSDGIYQGIVPILEQGISSLDAKIVDVNLDHPHLDAVRVLPEVSMIIHETTGQALCLDSRNAAALRKTCEIYPHKPIINSISGEVDVMRQLMPIVAEFETAVVLICSDDGGIPETVDQTIKVAEKLISSAESYGIPIENMIVDTLVSAAAVRVGAMDITLESLRKIREEFGVSTMLGVTNSGFGMPAHGVISQAFIITAIAYGLDLILAGHDDPFMPMLAGSKLAMDFLTARDPYGRDFLSAYRNDPSIFECNARSRIDNVESQ